MQWPFDITASPYSLDEGNSAHLPVRNVNVDGILVIEQAAHISHGCVQEAFLLVQPTLLYGARQRTRVRQHTNVRHLSQSHTHTHYLQCPIPEISHKRIR